MTLTVRILYDHQIFGMQRFGGISRYFCSLMRHLRGEDVALSLPLRFSDNGHLPEAGISAASPGQAFDAFLPGASFRGKWRLFQMRHLLSPLRDPARANRLGQIRSLRQGEFDVFHPTYYDGYFLGSLGPRPFVITVYDMIHERFPQLFQKSDRTAAQKVDLVKRAAHVICISETTRRDLMDMLGTPASKISVIHLGAPTEVHLPRNSLAQLPRDYLLYVGTRAPYKNFPFLLETVRPLLLRRGGLRLVCVGRPFDEHETGLLQRHGLLSRAEAHQVPEDQLADLYRGAVCHIVPSLYEGFGLTVLEAFAYDCPVACSNSGSLPEVAGDAASYFEPTDVGGSRRAIEQIVDDSKFAAALRLAGRRRAERFSWRATAQATLEVYRRVAQS